MSLDANLGQLQPPGLDAFGADESAQQPAFEGQPPDDATCLKVARQCCLSARSYMNSGIVRRWVNAYKAFQNEHIADSKYRSIRFRGRSKLYRPKTRGAVRKKDALAAAALFSTADQINVDAGNPGDPKSKAGAALMQELLAYRLDRKSGRAGIPWFMQCMASHQTAQVAGVCVSKQYWEYRTRHTGEYNQTPVLDEMGQPMLDGDTGGPTTEDNLDDPIMEVVRDRPMVRVYPPENVLRDPHADWSNQAQESSFVILLNPMSVGDVRAMSGPAKAGGGPVWRQVSDDQLKQATGQGRNAEATGVRRAREGDTTDRMQTSTTSTTEHTIIWVHENFIRYQGDEWHFWSLGDEVLLSDPIPVREAYPEQFGERPIVIGLGALEAHKCDPMSPVEAWQPLQQEVNDTVNLQLDAMKQNVSPTIIAKRGRKMDPNSIQNRSADTIIWADQPKEDLIALPAAGPSAQSYATMDRLNADFDDLAGNFNSGTVQTSRALNETVGGMRMLNQNANTLGEFDLRVWIETWVEPTLSQIVRLEQYYEADEKVIALAGQNAKLERFGVNEITDDLFANEVPVSVNAGLGASDPMQRLQKLAVASDTLLKIFGPSLAGRAKQDEFISEIMGAAGFKDGERFFYPGDNKDPRIQQAGQMIKSLQGELKSKEADQQNKIEVKKIDSATQLAKTQMIHHHAIKQAGHSAVLDMFKGHPEGAGMGGQPQPIAPEGNGQGQPQGQHTPQDQPQGMGQGPPQPQPPQQEDISGFMEETRQALQTIAQGQMVLAQMMQRMGAGHG